MSAALSFPSARVCPSTVLTPGVSHLPSPQGVCAAAQDAGPDAGQWVLRHLHHPGEVSVPVFWVQCCLSGSALGSPFRELLIGSRGQASGRWFPGMFRVSFYIHSKSH